MSYQPYPIVEVAIADLKLDRSNFRIDDVLPTESAAITYLFAEHDIAGLARQILIEGYVDNELILAVQEGGEYVVLEGNRRATALKALHDPGIAPREAAAYLESLTQKYEIEAENLPTAVRVMVAPDRLATQMLLARLHIGESKNRWGRDAQARFVIAQLESGKSIAMIRQELPGIKNAAAYVRQYNVRQLLKSTTFEDSNLAEYAAGPKLKMTSFEYAYGNPDVQRALGLAFDRDGAMVSRPSSPEQIRALEKLVSLYESNELNTRKFPKRTSATYETEMRDLLATLLGANDVGASSDDQPAGGSSTGAGIPHEDENRSMWGQAASGRNGASGAEPATGSSLTASGPPHVRGPNSPDARKSLHVTLEYGQAPVGIRKRLQELRSLDLNTHPVAAAILMRSVVEASIKWHFASQGNPVSGELGAVLREVHASYYSAQRSLRNVIDLLRDDSAKNLRPGSLRWFNMAAHDANSAMDPQSVRDAWQNVEHFVGFMLKRGAPPPAA